MSSKKVINLSYLTEVAGGENAIIKEMLELFKDQVPEFKQNMDAYLSEKKYLELGKEAHKAKSSMLVVGMDDLGKRLKELQLLTEEERNVDTYVDYVAEFHTMCDQALIDIEEELSKL